MSLSALANGVPTEAEAPMQRFLHHTEATRQLPERLPRIDVLFECLHLVGQMHASRTEFSAMATCTVRAVTFKRRSWPAWRTYLSVHI